MKELTRVLENLGVDLEEIRFEIMKTLDPEYDGDEIEERFSMKKLLMKLHLQKMSLLNKIKIKVKLQH